MKTRTRVLRTVMITTLAACLCASAAHAADFETFKEYKRENVDEGAFDGQWLLVYDQFEAYIPSEFELVPGSTSNSILGEWALEGEGDAKAGRFTVQDYSRICQSEAEGGYSFYNSPVWTDAFKGIQPGDDPYYMLAYLALFGTFAEEVSMDDFSTINGMPALVYAWQSYTQSIAEIFLFDGERYLEVYLFLKNYEDTETIINNFISSFTKLDFSSILASEDTAAAAETEAAAPAAQESAPKVYTDQATVKKVQEALNSAGFNCGTPDGVAGNNTNKAISDFKASKGLSGGTEITDELLAALGIS
ncbi:MAG: peptidoglycan-binding protein [Blautia sp.]|nr:peptidoglycan-binding protein [Blautia sp.]